MEFCKCLTVKCINKSKAYVDIWPRDKDFIQKITNKASNQETKVRKQRNYSNSEWVEHWISVFDQQLTRSNMTYIWDFIWHKPRVSNTNQWIPWLPDKCYTR